MVYLERVMEIEGVYLKKYNLFEASGILSHDLECYVNTKHRNLI